MKIVLVLRTDIENFWEVFIMNTVKTRKDGKVFIPPRLGEIKAVDH